MNEKKMLKKDHQITSEHSHVAHLLQKKPKEKIHKLPVEDILKKSLHHTTLFSLDLLKLSENARHLSYSDTLHEFYLLLLKEERFIYLGVFFVLLSILFMFVFLSS